MNRGSNVWALWRILGYAYILCWIWVWPLTGRFKFNAAQRILLTVWWGSWAAPLLIVVPARLLRGDKLWFQR